MKTGRWLVPLMLGFLITNGLRGQLADSSAYYAKERYEFLSDELQEYRAFIERERREHRAFLESYYTIVGSGAALLAGLAVWLIGFFGVRTRKDIRTHLESYRNDARERFQAELEKKEQQMQAEVEREIEKAKLAFEQEMSAVFSANLENYDEKYQAILNMAEQRLAVEKGRYLVISSADKLAQMQSEGAELQFFSKALCQPETHIAIKENKPSLSQADTVIYRSNVDEKGEDTYLKDVLLPMLVSRKEKVPLVVYARGREEFLKGDTEAALNNYLLYQIANNTGTLIDNTASSFRTYKLLQKNSQQA